MNMPTAAAAAPTDPLRARLKRLALDPRVALFPDGRAIVRELADLLDALDVLAHRVGAIETIAGVIQRQEFE